MEPERRTFERVLFKMAWGCLGVCQSSGWPRGWAEVGAYLGLECAEYIEAVRQGDKKAAALEAADILFVLLSSLASEDILIPDVVARLITLSDVTDNKERE